MDVLSEGKDREGHVEAVASEPAHIKLTQPIEEGGMSMIQFAAAMKKDAQDQNRLVKIIWSLVSETVERNDSRKRVSKLAMFEGDPAPIPALAYLARIKKYGGCSECCFVVALIYLERLKLAQPSVCLTSRNFQRLLLISIMIASKYLDDFYYSNKHWAEIGGLTTSEVNGLELEFLFRLAFGCSIQREDYDVMANQLLAYMSPSPTDSQLTDSKQLTMQGNDVPRGSEGPDPKQSLDSPSERLSKLSQADISRVRPNVSSPDSSCDGTRERTPDMETPPARSPRADGEIEVADRMAIDAY